MGQKFLEYPKNGLYNIYSVIYNLYNISYNISYIPLKSDELFENSEF